MERRPIIAKDILERCEDVGIYWFEEPFPEDRAFNEAFKAGPAPPNYFEMVEKGWIDVISAYSCRHGRQAGDPCC